jgi:peptidyl-prolyl cis-trans isomerase C
MKKDLLYTSIGVVLVVALCFGLAQMRPEFEPPKSEPFHVDKEAGAAAPVSKAAPPAGAKVVMRVNGEPVTDLEFQTFLSGMPENMQQLAQSPHGRRAIADQIASLIALAQEGRKMGIDSDKETRLRLDADQTNVLAMAALRKLVTGDEAHMREEYNKQKGNFESVELKHILIAYEGGKVPPRQGTTPLPLPAAMQKATQIEEQLRAGGDFAMTAKSQSDDVGSGQQGGELGPVPRGSLPPEVAATVFALKPGEVSRPLRTEFGVHIFKAGERKSPTFEQMRPQIEAEMQQKLAKETVERIKSGSKIELDTAFFGPEEKPAGPKNPA